MKPKISAIIKRENEIVIRSEPLEESLYAYVDFLKAIGVYEPVSNKLLHQLGNSDNNYSEKKFNVKLYQDTLFSGEWETTNYIAYFGMEKACLHIRHTLSQELLQNVLQKLFTISV